MEDKTDNRNARSKHRYCRFLTFTALLYGLDCRWPGQPVRGRCATGAARPVPSVRCLDALKRVGFDGLEICRHGGRPMDVIEALGKTVEKLGFQHRID